MNHQNTVVPGSPGDAADDGSDNKTNQPIPTHPPDPTDPVTDSGPDHLRPKGRGKGKAKSRNKKIEIRVVPEEVEALKERAAEASMTVSEFCRRASSGKRIISRYDYEVTRRLAELHGDQARLGNLFKASLDKDHQAYSQSDKTSIRVLLVNLEKNQESISRILREVEES